jgi:transposase-like protein
LLSEPPPPPRPAAKRFFRRALDRGNTRNPRTVVTDRLKSYPGALRELKRMGRRRRATTAGDPRGGRANGRIATTIRAGAD